MQDMKELQVIMTKNRAAKILGHDLPKLNQIKIRYDMGKWSGNVKQHKHDKDCIIWYERRQDRHGVYFALFTVQGFRLSDSVLLSR